MADNNDLKQIIERWKEANYRHLSCFDRKKIGTIFVALYSFKKIVELIDEGEDNKLKDKYETATVTILRQNIGDNGKISYDPETITFAVKKVEPKKKLIDEWNKLDDVKISIEQMKFLQITKDDLFELRYANYKAFIERVILQYASEQEGVTGDIDSNGDKTH